MPNREETRVLNRVVREFFGATRDSSPPTRAMRAGSTAAAFGYVAVFAALLMLFFANAVPQLSEGARYRIVATVGIVLFVSVPYIVPILPRAMRFGMIGAWAFILFGRGYYSELLSASAAGIDLAGECEPIQNLRRSWPSELQVDSLAYAIENDITLFAPERYLDLVFTSALKFSLDNSRAANNVNEALTALGLEGPAYDSFTTRMVSTKNRREDGINILDTWFAGFDLRYDTCDDVKRFYQWPSSAVEEGAAMPELRRGSFVHR